MIPYVEMGYLSDLTLNDLKSNAKTPAVGLPLWGILSLILFIIYIIHKFPSRELVQFVDDTTVFAVCRREVIARRNVYNNLRISRKYF